MLSGSPTKLTTTSDTNSTTGADNPTVQLAQLNTISLLDKLMTTPDGLSSEEAQRRRTRYGANEPAHPARFAALTQLLTFLVNPLVIILLVASLISGVLGERLN